MRHRAAGFTLIELMTGLALLALLLSLLFGGLRLASQGSEAGESAAERAGRMRIVSELLRRELAAVHPYRWRKDGEMRLAFVGGPEGLRYVSGVPPRVGAGGLRLVELKLTAGEEGLGLLMRLSPAGREPPVPGGLRQTDSVVLLDRLRGAGFQYYGPDAATGRARWHDTWDDPQRLPRLVRLSLRPPGAPPWPDLVVAPKIDEAVGCPNWDATSARCAS